MSRWFPQVGEKAEESGQGSGVSAGGRSGSPIGLVSLVQVVAVTLVVTGASGLVGSALTRTGDVKGLERAVLDITDADSIERMMDVHAPSAVINAAAQAGVDRADREPDHTRKVNALAVGSLAASCSRHGVRLVHLSTDYVLDYPDEDRLTEDLSPNPRSVYARTKHEGEQLALQHGAVVARLQWVFHPGERGFFNYALSQMRIGKRVRLVTDQIGCPTPAQSLAPILIEMARSGPAGLFHVATQGEATAWQWIEAGAEALGVNFRADSASRSDFDGAHRPARSCLDSSKLKAAWALELPDWRTALQTVCVSDDRMEDGVAT